MPNNRDVSLRYAFALLAALSLCLAAYPTCRMYSIIGGAVLLVCSLIFTRRPRTVLLVGIFASATIWGAALTDALLHGPITRRHNQRLAGIVQSHQLVGKSRTVAMSFLGSPTSTFAESNIVTLNYSPFKYFPHGIFQVHCEHETVVSIELYDD